MQSIDIKALLLLVAVVGIVIIIAALLLTGVVLLSAVFEYKLPITGIGRAFLALAPTLTFLYAEEYIKKDLTPALPKIKIAHGGFIPSVWKREDVHKLLEIIERNNPEGKRDYAILLTVTRLGLRSVTVVMMHISVLR